MVSFIKLQGEHNGKDWLLSGIREWELIDCLQFSFILINSTPNLQHSVGQMSFRSQDLLCEGHKLVNAGLSSQTEKQP